MLLTLVWIGISAQNSKKKGAKDVVYTVVEKMPEYPGGEDSLMVFLAGKFQT